MGTRLTKIITRWPRSTIACASLDTVMQDVEMPWTKTVFFPSSGPHSYTRMVPYYQNDRVSNREFIKKAT